MTNDELHPSSTPLSASSSRTSFREVFRESLRLLPLTFSAAAKSLIVLQLIRVGAEQYFAFAMEEVQSRGQEDFVLIALIVALSLTFNLLWSTLWTAQAVECTLAGIYGRPAAVLKELLPRYLNPLLIEQIRALAAILLRLPLLVIPALVEYIRLSFVPFVVMLHPGYEQGEVNALKESRQLVRGRFVMLTLWSLVTLVFPVIFDQLFTGTDSTYIWENPLGVLISAAFTFFMNLLSLIFLVVLFRRLRPAKPPVSS